MVLIQRIALGCALALMPAPVLAQSFTGAGPLRALVLPTEPRGSAAGPFTGALPPQGAPVLADEAGPRAAVRPAPRREPANPTEIVRPLPANLGGFRLAGEWARSEWAVHLTAAQAQAVTRFRLRHFTAISALPEASHLTVMVNDTVVHQQPLHKVGALVASEIAIPPGLLQPGYNAVRIMAQHRHRVDCSPAATHELWTSLDGAQSGFVLPAEAARKGLLGFADLASLVPAADGSLPIRIRLDGKLSAAMMSRALRAAQLVALSSGTLQPVVSFGDAEADAAGVTLVVGTRDDLSTLADLAPMPAVPGGSHGFLAPVPRQTAELAPVYAASGRDLAEIDHALDRWSAQLAARSLQGTAAGLVAARRMAGLAVSGEGERISLAMTGFADMAFTGRVLKVGLDLVMPADILPADYDRLILNLAGSHSADLAAGASILVEVNGALAATQQLGKSTANALDRNEIFLPLRLLRPGHNRIAITAEIAARRDATCAPGLAPEEKRLELLAASELVLPRIARVGRMPELALALNGGLGTETGSHERVLHVPAPDRQAMAAAATLTTRMAVVAGRPVPHVLMLTPPTADARDLLIVAPAPQLDPDMMRQAGLDPEAVRQAWQAQTSPDQPLARRQRHPDDELSAGCLLPQGAEMGADRALPVQGQGRAPASLPGLSLARLWQMASLPEGALPRFVSPRAEAAPSLVAPDAVLLLAQGLMPGGRTVTIVTGASPAALALGVQCLGPGGSWPAVGGQLAALRQDETIAVQRSGAAIRYVSTQPPAVGNLRLVAAGWFSLNPIVYMAMSLLLGLIVAVATLWLVKNTGRPQEPGRRQE